MSYSWKHTGQWHSVAVEADPVAQPMLSGSEEEFLTEHYWGYTRRSRGATCEYGVEHPRWQTYPIRSFKIEADLGSLYGPTFASLDASKPVSVLLAEGSAVSVSDGNRLPH